MRYKSSNPWMPISKTKQTAWLIIEQKVAEGRDNALFEGLQYINICCIQPIKPVAGVHLLFGQWYLLPESFNANPMPLCIPPLCYLVNTFYLAKNHTAMISIMYAGEVCWVAEYACLNLEIYLFCSWRIYLSSAPFVFC